MTQTTIPCPHHGHHLWTMGNLDTITRNSGVLRRAAAQQLSSLCPAPGNVLTFCQIMGETDSPVNWSLRRSPEWADEDETTIATAIR
jgi:hypothetical protein